MNRFTNVSHPTDTYDNDSKSLETTTENEHDEERLQVINSRNELDEARKFASKDTKRLRLWRLVVTSVLLVTAFAVTYTTYTILQKQEVQNFKTAFYDFACGVGDAAVDQQRRMRQEYVSFANLVSSAAYRENATWPMYRVPNFELHAAQVRLQSGSEVFGIQSIVEQQDGDKYLEFVTANYEDSLREGHQTLYGNLDRLIPVGYNNNFTTIGRDGKVVVDNMERPLRSATWQISPPLSSYHTINWDTFSTLPDYWTAFGAVSALKNESVITPVRRYTNGGVLSEEEHNAMHSILPNSNVSFPHSFLAQPVHQIPGDDKSKIVAWLGGGFAWDFALRNLLPDGVNGILIEIRNSCNQTCVYKIMGKDAFYIGENATHETKYSDMEVVRDLSFHTHPNFTTTPGHCIYKIHIFPTATFYNSYDTKTPETYAIVVALTFVLVAVVFFIYDVLVHRRNNKMVVNTARVNAVVSDIFPEAIRERILNRSNASLGSATMHLQSFLLNGGASNDDVDKGNSKPLADLFLETTVMYADIAGFTAWSSVRDPSQVFSLLESLFNAFDEIAKRRHVFKVETVGDCYVAVTGLPKPQKDHAVIMARFARDVLSKMDELAKKLEVSLGPGTGELRLRIGLHSGPVTGGVLRGERSRFQLFGDTMNTGARMESHGEKGRIHVSADTAALLISAGKQSWLSQRENCIVAKGKGTMQTYWLTCHDASPNAVRREAVPNIENSFTANIRLIDWNVEQLTYLIKQIVACRHRRTTLKHKNNNNSNTTTIKINEPVPIVKGTTTSPIDEVQEIITLPKFDRSCYHHNCAMMDMNDIVIPREVMDQLKLYVTWIASMYRDNAFHNFHHASHVLMSVMKLMSRIVAPTADVYGSDGHVIASTLHDHTYGITSDPLTQFACAYSALIHDLDHDGVPNTTLVKEGSDIARKYKNRSIAEQNSLDIAYDALMYDEQYDALRTILFDHPDELIRFRQLVVNCVMATDIADKDLKALRNARWDKAFSTNTTNQYDTEIISNNDISNEQSIASIRSDTINRKATIVIEHLIQASDVSHTMQHWHVFRKWNYCLFEEMYVAYRNGRADINPSDFWYDGEIQFFQYYIIPLTMKLKDCGIFGVSSDEYYNYAIQNLEEWKVRGQDIVLEMIEQVQERMVQIQHQNEQQQQHKNNNHNDSNNNGNSGGYHAG